MSPFLFQQDEEAKPIHLADQEVEEGREEKEPQVAAAMESLKTAKAS